MIVDHSRLFVLPNPPWFCVFRSMFWSYNLYMVHPGDCSSTSGSRMSRPMSGSKTHGENTWWKPRIFHNDSDVQSCSISSHNGPFWCVKPPSLWGNLASYPWKNMGTVGKSSQIWFWRPWIAPARQGTEVQTQILGVN
jgi:hypothetical protein